MKVRKSISMLMTVIAGVLAVMTTMGDYAALADDRMQSVSILNLPYFLIFVIGVGVIGSATFLFVIFAEVMRRRRKKYSCIQH